jgi:Histidine phosphatase superfamily (branch 1)
MARASRIRGWGFERGRRALLALASAAMLAWAAASAAQDAPAIANAESSAPSPAAALQGASLLAALRGGGFVVYFRHTATDFSRGDAGMRDYADCANQRLLSEQGRRDAREIGRSIRTLGLPVAEALASPYCRTMEHARLMLPGVSARNEIREAQGGDYAGLKRLLAQPVAAGGNRWIVGHGIPFRAVAGPPHLAEGEAVVIRPGTTGWTVVARIAVADWPALAAQAR